MLGLGNGLIIHADGKKVSIEIISDALQFATDQASAFTVYRRKGLSDVARNTIAAAARRYYERHYSFFLMYLSITVSGDRPAQFCSQLAAHAYGVVGIRMTTLPENRILPVDLFLLCQKSEHWKDVTNEFTREPSSPDADKILPRIPIPGEGELSVSEFLSLSDKRIRESAEATKQVYDIVYKTVRDGVRTEALLSKHSAARFDLAKLVYLAPSEMDDEVSGWIVRVLEQLQSLMSLSLLPNIYYLISSNFLRHFEEIPGSSAYVGLPKADMVTEMERSREIINIYTYLVLAETGLLCVLAYATPHDKFEKYRSIKREYNELFLKAIPKVDDLSAYEKGENLFPWVKEESDRAWCKSAFDNILKSLRVIGVLRSQQRDSQGSR
jgi:hypothetical protein